MESDDAIIDVVPVKAEVCQGASTMFNRKALAKFMSLDEDNDLVIFRKFKKLSFYILLDKQERLRQIEDNLRRWEQENNNQNGVAAEIQNAETLLKEYHEALLLQKQIMKLPVPPKTIIRYLKVEAPLRWNEWCQTINNNGIDDLVSLAEREEGFIDRYVRKTPLLEKLILKRTDDKTPDGINLYSANHVKQFETVVITMAFNLLVLGPTAALSYLNTIWFKLVIVSVAMVIMSVVTAALTNNSHRLSLAVIAAYTAILAVFLGSSH